MQASAGIEVERTPLVWLRRSCLTMQMRYVVSLPAEIVEARERKMCWSQEHWHCARVARTLWVPRMAWRKQEAAVLKSAVVLAFADVIEMTVAHSLLGGNHSLPHLHSAVLLTVLLVKEVVLKSGNVPVEEGHGENVHLCDVLEH